VKFIHEIAKIFHSNMIVDMLKVNKHVLGRLTLYEYIHFLPSPNGLI